MGLTLEQVLLNKVEKKIKPKMIECLANAGRTAVDYARQNGNYQDNTGNLRSSIGYAVSENGVIVSESSFEAVGSGSLGSQTGKAKAEAAAARTNGMAVSLVAGMDYADYVESKGYDVLSGAKMVLKEEITKKWK